MRKFKTLRPGLIDYQKALFMQKKYLIMMYEDQIEDLLMLLEHPHTFTIGRGGNIGNLHVSTNELKRKGIHFEVISRGGDITYHGPGQLVVYPIIDLNHLKKDVHYYLRLLEEVLIRTLKKFDIDSERKSGLTGVWVDEKKIASIGVGVSRWVTYHGFALNVNTDLSYFDFINPCGMDTVNTTSMKEYLCLDRDVPINIVEDILINIFGEVFDRTLDSIDDTLFKHPYTDFQHSSNMRERIHNG